MRQGPSHTASYVCWARALEARNPPGTRVVWDPFAYDFLGFFGRLFYWFVAALGPLGRWLIAKIPNFNQYIVARHRVMDDWIRSMSPRQLVILGAGYDMRALRLDLADLEAVFEVDHPLTGARKRLLVDGLDQLYRDINETPPQRPQIEYVSVDFQKDKLDERLVERSFDRSVPTAWVWEGVSMYLSESQVKNTLAAIRDLSAPGSTLTMDLAFDPGRGSLRLAIMALVRRIVGFLGEPWELELHPRELETWLRPQGFSVVELYTVSRLNAEVLVGRGGAIGSLYVACLRITDKE